MKFAINFYRGCRVLPKADELIIKYKEKNPNLIPFVQKYQEQRVIADITELKDLKGSLNLFRASAEINPSFSVLISLSQDFKVLKEANINFFFAEGADTYEQICTMVSAGITDIYIINELGFDLLKISEYCHAHNVQVRVFPNVAQSSSILSNNSINNFFIRPEAVSIYENIIDVFEFYGNLEAQAPLFEIYKEGRWFGELGQIILGLDTSIQNTTILPMFDDMRLKCKKRCTIGKCDICEVIKRFGKVLKEKEIDIVKRKVSHEYTVDEKNMSDDSASIISFDAELSDGEKI